MIQTNTLIPINYDSDRPTVSARELHNFLEIDTRFNVWFPRMTAYGFTENADFARLSQKCDTLGGEQTTVDYQLTLDMAKELCMIQRTERGKQARQYFIEIEKRWNDPETLMARALKMADEKIGRLESRIESEKPKVLFADSVCASKNSILVGEMAKLLKQNGVDIGEKRFFRWLRENGYLIARYGTDYNMPTQKSMELKIFEIKETSITHSSGTVTVSKTPKLTGKGQQYFINKFLGKEANNS